MRKKFYDVAGIIEDYTQNDMGLEGICSKYHVGKLKVKEILGAHGIAIKKKGKQPLNENFIVKDWKTEKYTEEIGYEYIAIDRNTEFETKDYLNRGGVLTTYIRKTYGVETPSLYDRRLYYMRTGNYWWEQWFTIAKRKKHDVKVCPICGWETVDVDNTSGYFSMHLKNMHSMTVEDYLKQYPEDENYFPNYVVKKRKEEKMKLAENYIICPLCGKKFERITESHLLSKHKMTLADFKKQYPNHPVMSSNVLQQSLEAQKYCNLYVSKNRFISSYEKELKEFFDNNHIFADCNRQILNGKEIDILIPSHNLGIEFNGLKFHTEVFGKKSRTYHLDKTKACNDNGYGLIHIFEDEYVNSKEIVYNKLKHILRLDGDLPKIGGRKCNVRIILKEDAKNFLNNYHIQGYQPSTYYYGAFYKDELVGVMCFKYQNLPNGIWELTRYATKYGYIYQGLGSKMFKRFLRDHNPFAVISFADRRWTVSSNNNLYTKMGFMLDSKTGPEYRYYNEKIDKYKRVHKMNFRKDKLIKKYGFPDTMTEWEMARELGYDRIWDCGLFKYVYYNTI